MKAQERKRPRVTGQEGLAAAEEAEPGPTVHFARGLELPPATPQVGKLLRAAPFLSGLDRKPAKLPASQVTF